MTYVDQCREEESVMKYSKAVPLIPHNNVMEWIDGWIGPDQHLMT
jgi:hypothetical protein